MTDGAQPRDAEEYPIKTTLADGVPAVTETPEELAEVERLLGASSEPVAVDTERAQGFRYGAEAWLVQIRRQDVGTFLIDSNRLPDLSSLGQTLQAPWIFHAADQDLYSLAELGLRPDEIFDTEVAARLAGLKQFSLRGACEAMLGYTLEKTHQNENWSVRPLPADWLRYAAMDVEVLPDLHAALSERLESLGRLEWAEEEFTFALANPMVPRESRWQNLKGVGGLRRPKELAIARELWSVREEIARGLDISPGRLLSTRAVIEAARRNPQSKREMLAIEPFRRPRARQYSDDFWGALRTVRGLTPEEMPTLAEVRDPGPVPPLRSWKRSRPDAVKRLGAVRALVLGAAEPLGLDPEVVLLPATQRALAWDPLPRGSAAETQSRALKLLDEAQTRPWQLELLDRSMSDSPDKLRALSAGN